MTLNELQRHVGEYDRRFGWTGDRPEHTLIHMQEEVGEISRHILRMLNYREGEFDRSEVNDEISDLIYLTLKLGNLLDLNLDEGWDRIVGRYESK
jgi:NTP pyrophosphatase (non-canonical NTP hydrolase)